MQTPPRKEINWEKVVTYFLAVVIVVLFWLISDALTSKRRGGQQIIHLDDWLSGKETHK